MRWRGRNISTHALREEGDGKHTGAFDGGAKISTHALREEGDEYEDYKAEVSGKISTHALREEGDGIYPRIHPQGRKFLPTPSARRATVECRRHQACCPISTHALREEGDYHGVFIKSIPFYFYPRPPRGGRPWATLTVFNRSIFLPTPSARRATQKAFIQEYLVDLFLPTPSARRATPPCQGRSWQDGISTHALREEGDRMASKAVT